MYPLAEKEEIILAGDKKELLPGWCEREMGEGGWEPVKRGMAVDGPWTHPKRLHFI